MTKSRERKEGKGRKTVRERRERERRGNEKSRLTNAKRVPKPIQVVQQSGGQRRVPRIENLRQRFVAGMVRVSLLKGFELLRSQEVPE
jgi:hypothetical protein